MALAIILKQPVGVFRRVLLECVNIGPVRKENDEIPVVVVVEYGHASGHRLRSVAFRRLTTVESEIDRPECEMDRSLHGWTGRGDPGPHTHECERPHRHRSHVAACFQITGHQGRTLLSRVQLTQLRQRRMDLAGALNSDERGYLGAPRK